jgi:hypothetical protein
MSRDVGVRERKEYYCTCKKFVADDGAYDMEPFVMDVVERS